MSNCKKKVPLKDFESHLLRKCIDFLLKDSPMMFMFRIKSVTYLKREKKVSFS